MSDDIDDEIKPCVPITCPPLEDYVIDVIVPARNYVPGQFAREAAAFYGMPDPFPENGPLCTCRYDTE